MGTAMVEERIDAHEILGSLTLEEKVYLMSGKIDFNEVRGAIKKQSEHHYNHIPYPAGGIPEKGLPEMRFCDGPRGVVCGTGKSTCFPVPMLRGASFDTALEEKIGHAVAKEVLAYGGNLFAGVCINLLYHPGWGRGQETYGEESFHLGEMGAALTRGVDAEHVMACVKHYAFNQMENSRFKVDITCSKRTEREVFLPHFKKCVDAGAASVMTSYNKYQGTYCGHHPYLIDQVLKKEWGFDGFVMSDFVWGIRDTVEAAVSGQDMEMCCTKYYGDSLVTAVKEGLVPAEKIDAAALRIIRTILAYTSKAETGSSKIIGCAEHVKLALQSAREGITLLKNDNGVLPFDKKKTRNIVVFGQLADEEVTGDRGSSEVYPKYVVTPLRGILKSADSSDITYYSGNDLDHCRTLAREADAVIFVVGNTFRDEGEYVAEDENDVFTGAVGGDRKTGLGLHPEDIEMLRTVGPVNRNSAVVMIGGSMIMVEDWLDDVSSILMAYYAGMEGGTAIGEILFGDVNPSGKLPFVTPKRESDLPALDWDTEAQSYDYYHGYTKLDKEGIAPRFPFGYGLSYTTFSIDEVGTAQDATKLIVNCRLTNTGKRYGEEVVQLYVGFRDSAVDRPVRILRGFQREGLKPGESRTVTISCAKDELCWYDEETGRMEFEEMIYEVYIGTSSDPADLVRQEIALNR